MSVAITCASCNRPLRVPESALGQTVQCPLCLDEFTARTDPAAEAAARAAAPRRRAAAPRPVAEAAPAPLAPILEDPTPEAVPILEAVPEPAAVPHDGPRRALVFPVVVMRDPDRVLRGPMDGELTTEGLSLRKMRYPSAFAAVGARARYLGANRLAVTVEGREIELVVAKPWASNYHLARDAAAFLNAQGPFPNGPSYNLPWYLYAIPPLFLALPFAAAPFGLFFDGCLGAFLWTVVALVLGLSALIVARQKRLRPRARLVTALSLLGVGVALPLLAIPLTPAYSVDPSLWRSYTAPGGDFTVQVPGTPTLGTTVGFAGAPAGQKYIVDLKSPEIQFAVFTAPAPGNGPNAWNPDNQAINEVKARLQQEYCANGFSSMYPEHERQAYVYGRVAWDITYRHTDYGNQARQKTLVARIIVFNNRLYALAVLGPRVRLDGADVNKFFNSFRLGTPPDGAPPPAVKQTTITGIVTQTFLNQLSIQPDGPGPRTFIVPDDAVVTINGRAGKLQDVKDHFAVTITERAGKVVKVEVTNH